jgi:hypothetical protein
VTVQQKLEALLAVAGPEVRALVSFEHNAVITGIVSRWPKASSAERANKLGLFDEKNFEDIIRQYIADCKSGPDAAAALKGFKA